MEVKKKKRGPLPKLTPMQTKFAEALIFFEGRKYAYEAAEEAGYEKDRARITASELQNPKLYPMVTKYIGILRDERNKKYGVSYGGHLTELGRIRDQALKDRSYSAATVAEKARGQVGGYYFDQKIVRTGKLDDLTEEELDNRIKTIKEDNAVLLEAPEDKTEEKPEDIKPKLPLV